MGLGELPGDQHETTLLAGGPDWMTKNFTRMQEGHFGKAHHQNKPIVQMVHKVRRLGMPRKICPRPQRKEAWGNLLV